MAVSADRVLLWAGDKTLRSLQFSNSAQDNRAGSIRESLDALLAAAGATQANLHIAVMPDVARCGLVDIPRMGPEMLHALVTDNAHRFFLLPEHPVSTGACQAGRGRKTVTFAAIAFDDVLAPIRSACGPTCTIMSVVPAQAAWSCAAAELSGKKRAIIAVVANGVCDVVVQEHGATCLVRRLSLGDGAMACDTILQLAGDQRTAPVVLAGAKHDVTALRERLHAHGMPFMFSEIAAETLAAQYALLATSPRLVNEVEYSAHLLRMKQKTSRTVLAALMLFATSVALDLGHARRDAEALREMRGLHRAEAAAASNLLRELESVQQDVAALDSLRGGSIPASQLVAHLAEFLPNDAYATEFAIANDTAVIRISAVDAAAAFAGLRRSTVMARADAEGSIRRISRPDGFPSETFAVRLSLRAREGGRLAPGP